MVKVTKKTRQDIDSTLEWLLGAWGDLPKIAEEIDGWDLVERIDFLYEWPLEEARLADLRKYANQGMMDLPQDRRYRALEARVAQNRSIIEELHERYNR